jgi:hypothetical protein
MLNQNIIHLINDIFWNMGFKTETQADKVMPIIRVIYIIRITSIMSLILIIHIICRFVRILDWLTTCGRTKGH